MIDNLLDLVRGRLGGGLALDRDAEEPLQPVLQMVINELKAARPDRPVNCEFHIGEPANCDR